ncbi:unnamed protein product, partial [Amoebophrya sp. A120]|eukprot:GSA120T00005168001.1
MKNQKNNNTKSSGEVRKPDGKEARNGTSRGGGDQHHSQRSTKNGSAAAKAPTQRRPNYEHSTTSKPLSYGELSEQYQIAQMHNASSSSKNNMRPPPSSSSSAAGATSSSLGTGLYVGKLKKPMGGAPASGTATNAGNNKGNMQDVGDHAQQENNHSKKKRNRTKKTSQPPRNDNSHANDYVSPRAVPSDVSPRGPQLIPLRPKNFPVDTAKDHRVTPRHRNDDQ